MGKKLRNCLDCIQLKITGKGRYESNGIRYWVLNCSQNGITDRAGKPKTVKVTKHQMKVRDKNSLKTADICLAYEPDCLDKKPTIKDAGCQVCSYPCKEINEGVRA